MHQAPHLTHGVKPGNRMSSPPLGASIPAQNSQGAECSPQTLLGAREVGVLLGYGGLSGTRELLGLRRLPLGPEEQGEMVGPASGQNLRAGTHPHVGPGWTGGAPLPRPQAVPAPRVQPCPSV